jgi:MarR family 2-MHQ and catechol resistance regulon transcriptional repressor
MGNGPHIRLILWKAAKAVEKIDRASIAQTGLGLSDFAILEVLLHKGPLPIKTIGEKVLLTSGSMTAAVNRLEKRGLVTRRRDPSDGRSFRIHLIPAGRRVIEQAFAEHRRRLDDMAGCISREESAELVRLLKKVGFHAVCMAKRA